MVRDSLKFRSRKLDGKRVLPIYRASQLPDLDDTLSLSRTLPQVSTGVEKEEEEEHHLQAAISSYQAANTNGEAKYVYIPTPDASLTVPDDEYNRFYPKQFNPPTTLIRFSIPIEECVSCPYNMDENDDQWLKSFNEGKIGLNVLSEDDFEFIMNAAESLMELKYDKTQLITLEDLNTELEARSLSHLKGFAVSVYSHWESRRRQRMPHPVHYALNLEEASAKNENDPYVCFRRREVRQLRKTRRTDAQALQQMKKLRTEMETAKNLLQMVSRREKLRKESLMLDTLAFERRLVIKQWKRQLNIDDAEIIQEVKPIKKVKRRAEARATVALPFKKSRDEPKRPEDMTALEIISSKCEEEVKRRVEADEGWEDLTMAPYQGFLRHPYYSHIVTKLKLIKHEKESPKLLRCRRRIGRGGRLIYDRSVSRWLKNHVPSLDSTEQEQWRTVMNKYKFEDGSDEEDLDAFFDETQPSTFGFRSRLLSESDQKLLSTYPTRIPPPPPPPSAPSIPKSRPWIKPFPFNMSNQGQMSASVLPTQMSGMIPSSMPPNMANVRQVPHQQQMQVTQSMNGTQSLQFQSQANVQNSTNSLEPPSKRARLDNMSSQQTQQAQQPQQSQSQLSTSSSSSSLPNLARSQSSEQIQATPSQTSLPEHSSPSADNKSLNERSRASASPSVSNRMLQQTQQQPPAQNMDQTSLSNENATPSPSMQNITISAAPAPAPAALNSFQPLNLNSAQLQALLQQRQLLAQQQQQQQLAGQQLQNRMAGQVMIKRPDGTNAPANSFYLPHSFARTADGKTVITPMFRAPHPQSQQQGNPMGNVMLSSNGLLVVVPNNQNQADLQSHMANNHNPNQVNFMMPNLNMNGVNVAAGASGAHPMQHPQQAQAIMAAAAAAQAQAAQNQLNTRSPRAQQLTINQLPSSLQGIQQIQALQNKSDNSLSSSAATGSPSSAPQLQTATASSS